MQTKEILDLADQDGYGNARGEAYGNGHGDEADQPAQLAHTHQRQQDARHHGGDDQPIHPLGGDDACHDGGEGGGRTGDLYAAAAQQGYGKAGEDGGIHALLRGGAGGQRQGDGQGQGDDGDDDTRHQVLHQLLPGVALEGRHELRLKIKRFHFLIHILY